ncbi:MAG TPA: TIGR00730 family Rossman fold protein [Prolixibacteraceae bacterium]|nr:TIGR00730 family Rossman fold protein [Prolixibacteraceae bacterium]
MKICVFCSSSNAVDQQYFKHAKELGEILSENGHELIYGGANVGLMEHIAHSVKNHGGKVTGVIPQKIYDNNLMSHHPDETIVTATMDERKKMMRDNSDAFIALPGGFGTLEEILEVITLKQLDYHQKPIVFINTKNFYGKLLEQFEQSYSEHFAKENYRQLYTVVENPKQALEYIENYKHNDLGLKWYKVPEKQ